MSEFHLIRNMTLPFIVFMPWAASILRDGFSLQTKADKYTSATVHYNKLMSLAIDCIDSSL